MLQPTSRSFEKKYYGRKRVRAGDKRSLPFSTSGNPSVMDAKVERNVRPRKQEGGSGIRSRGKLKKKGEFMSGLAIG